MPRARLLRRLAALRDVPVVAVVAPPGYGKTTLLAQWAERDPRPFAWLRIDARDHDPGALLTSVAWLSFARRSGALPGVVVLDDAHRLEDSRLLDLVVALADQGSQEWQMVVAGRGEPPLPLARLRAQGRVAEIGPEDLAMDQDEARWLLRGVGVHLSETEIGELTRRTEGWPVALHLASRSLRMRRPRKPDGTAWLADDRLVVDYLRSVLLSSLRAEDARFLTRTAVLDRLCGPLCDAVLERSGSAAWLESLERSNLLVIPLDRNRWWYRYHGLFRSLLRAELERREPGLSTALMRRASRWCERNGLLESAIEYGMRAGDAEQVARLVPRVALWRHHHGGAATVQRWLDWFDHHGLVERYPGAAAVGAWIHLLAGRPAAADRWAEAAGNGPLEEPLPDGSTSLDGWLTTLRAARCRDGTQRMATDAVTALELLPVASPWRATALLLLSISEQLGGDLDRADRGLARTVEVAEDAGATETASVALAIRAKLATDRGQWREAERLAGQASSIARDAGLDTYPTSTLLHAVRARLAIHTGDLPEAREHLAAARRLRPRLTQAVPFPAVQSELELIRAYATLLDTHPATDLLRGVNDVLRRRPDLGFLKEEAEELGAQLDRVRAGTVGSCPLTPAELRLLPQLATHLSFREIAERQQLSPHTIKSQAIAIYRKFGVSSRSEMIQRAQDRGLLARSALSTGRR